MKKETNTIAKNNSCIIWDNENYPQSIFGKSQDPIFYQKIFEKTNFAKYDLIYILVELKWQDVLRTKFHGFQLAKDLRKDKTVLCPIVFCTFMPCFDKSLYPDSEILDMPGHYLHQLPVKPILLQEYAGIDEDTLEDINFSLFDPDQKVHTLMHNVENRLPGLVYNIERDEREYDRNRIKTEVNTYLDTQLKIFKTYILPEKTKEFDFLGNELQTNIDSTIDEPDFTPEKLRSPLITYKDLFYSFLPTHLVEDVEKSVVPKRWQVLFIDDQEYYCNIIKVHFERNGIQCHTAQSAEKAFEILREDENGVKKISVIITDFRFYVDGNSETGKWQDLQGYTILKQIHSHQEFKSHYAYFMLTSKKGTIQHHIKKQSKFPILWFNKTDVTSGGNHSFDVFCQRIDEVGSEAFLKKHSLPDTEVWKTGIENRIEPGLCFYYKHHIEYQDFENAERNINLKATENIDYALKNGELLDDFDYQISLKYSSKHSTLDDLLKKFRTNILLPRRIFWILSILEEMSYDDLITIFKRTHKMKRSIFTTSLGISLRKRELSKIPFYYFQYGMLDEEKEFLMSNKKRNEDTISRLKILDTDISIIRVFFDEIEDIIDFPLFKNLYYKLENNNEFTFTIVEIKKCLKQIGAMMKMNPEFNKQYREETKYFYKDYVELLSDGLKVEFLNLLK
ncbi:MAG: hypothetical protein IH598_12850 [Bacteroidales bacterium]|nr:hypothetical protein [Bacteroidales bacterium]